MVERQEFAASDLAISDSDTISATRKPRASSSRPRVRHPSRSF